MKETYTATASITIHCPTSRVWDALIQPELIQQYLFGTQVTTSWQVGSSITYRGEWQGKAYEDKGVVLQFEPGKRIVSTYWSSLEGLPDLPENYKTVHYELSGEDGAARLTILQGNNSTEEDARHSEQNWKMVLEGIKKLLEG